MKTAAAAVGINPQVRVSPHTCRHTFAQQELKNGLDLYSLSRLLGHESVNITQRYLESMEDAQVLRKAKSTGVLGIKNRSLRKKGAVWSFQRQI